MTYCFHHTLLNIWHVIPLQDITLQETAIHCHCCEKFRSQYVFFYPLSGPHIHYLLNLNFITFFMILTQLILLKVSSYLNYKRHTRIWWIYDQSQHIFADNWHWQSYQYFLIRTTYCKVISLKLSKMPENVTVKQITYNNSYKLLNNLFKQRLIPLVRKRGSNSCPTNICICDRIWIHKHATVS
jgi:hypothetical protein